MACQVKMRESIKRALQLLEKRDRTKLRFLVVIQVLLNLLDLLGVALIGVIGALSVNGISSRDPGNQVARILKFMQIENLTLQQQVGILAVTVTIVLVGKTLFSLFFTRRSLYFLGAKSAKVSRNILSKVLSQSLTSLQRRGAQDITYVIAAGINSLILSVLGAGISLIADLSLLIILALSLFIVSPSIALSSILFFGFVGLVLYRTMHLRAQEIGLQDAKLSVQTSDKLLEVLSSYREAIVRDRRAFYVEKVGNIQFSHSHILAERTFMPNISKYVIEISIILGALLVSGVQFFLQDASHAIATLSIFMAAGSRIAPASLRIQQSLIQIKTSIGVSTSTFDLLDDLAEINPVEDISPKFIKEHKGFDPTISLQSVNYTYPENKDFGIKHMTIGISAGKSLAIVGTSGAGKTTLIDLILGVLEPTSGSIKISGKSPRDAIRIWPGAISYVPQDVLVINGTIRENICLGYAPEEISDEEVIDALIGASLVDFVESLPMGINTEVGERGSKISGGQRQRIGIARALVSNPALIVLDEATSSLDGETESQITDALNKVKGNCTVVMIAHRLSSVRDSDLVIYLDKGQIIAQGSFTDVRNQVPNFDKQALLMGL
jgi:ABC-type multidrug transport system fused ATPase/permease subunit